MNILSKFPALILASLACIAFMSGCGSSSSSTAPATPSNKLTLTAANVPAGVQLGSLKVTIAVPAGVSIGTDNTGQVLDGVIVPAGAAATGTTQVVGNYQAASRTLVISLVSTAGFGTGACAVITFDVTAGTTLAGANFTVTTNEAKDAGPTYGSISGVTASLM